LIDSDMNYCRLF